MKEPTMTKGPEKGIPCILQGCTGMYEHRKILHCVERSSEVVCVDHVPALVCTVCGDVQFETDTVRRLQALMETRGKPDKHLPAYEFKRSRAAA